MTYPREYLVARLPAGSVPLSHSWEEKPWSDIAPLRMEYHMGEPPAHRPAVQAWLAYDDDALYASFRVDDRYVLATAEKHQDPVCIDSCVELFFTPGPDVGQGYFNIECNCGGVVLFHHQQSRAQAVQTLSPEAIRAMDIRHTLPARVVPELPGPLSWSVSYRVPFDHLEHFAPVARPAPGVLWRANLYKCADRSSHPHWLTWSPVDLPRPDFHRKEYFGTLRFA
jgi:hypothetical protein